MEAIAPPKENEIDERLHDTGEALCQFQAQDLFVGLPRLLVGQFLEYQIAVLSCGTQPEWARTECSRFLTKMSRECNICQHRISRPQNCPAYLSRQELGELSKENG